jgi:hypothetical protein
MALQPPPRKPLARNLKNLAQRNSIYPYLGQPLIHLAAITATHAHMAGKPWVWDWPNLKSCR